MGIDLLLTNDGPQCRIIDYGVYNGTVRVPFNFNLANGVLYSSAGANYSVNGYQRLNDYLLLQWGSVTGLSGYGYTTITFPVTFSQCFTVVQTEYLTGDQTAGAVRGVSWWNNSQARLGYEYNGCTWIAIGI